MSTEYNADTILVLPNGDDASELILSISPQSAGWDFINFEVRRLQTGATWSFETGDHEFAFVNLTGRYRIESSRGSWQNVGARSSVFQSAAHALYLPRHTSLTVTAEEGGDFAATWVPADEDFSPYLIRPEDVDVSVRGGDNVSRQINDLLPPGSPVQRLVLVEVYTPSGNWSSYPPHKHDVHIEGENGELVEADLEEVYFYRIDPQDGYAYQRVYTDENSPLHQAGKPIDGLVRAVHNSAVLVPEGYHPVVSAPGYTTYYLNVLAGSAQSLANQDDPRYTWVKESYRGVDDRLPLY